MSEEREAFEAWAKTKRFNVQGKHDAWLGWQAGRQSAGAKVQETICATCNGHGMIGGPSYYATDEGGEPCPACAAPIGDNGAKVAELEKENFALSAGQCVHEGGVMMDEYGHTLCPLTKTDDAQPAESKRVELTEPEILEAAEGWRYSTSSGCTMYSFSPRALITLIGGLLTCAQAKEE